MSKKFNYDEALQEIWRLMSRSDLNSEDSLLLTELLSMVEDYEDEHYPMGEPTDV